MRTALDAHSRGVGQLIAAAVAAGAGRIVVGLGGSGCTDGGRGMVEALGGLTAARALLDGVELIAASDVEHPLLGPMGAAAVFGPQKGADPDTVAVLEDRLTAWAEELNAAAGRTVSDDAGAGCGRRHRRRACIALGGRRESGAAIIAEHTGLGVDVAAADLVITGEGRFDDQSLHGKVVSALAAGARARQIPVVVLAGQVTLEESALRGRGHRLGVLHHRPCRVGAARDRGRGQPAHRPGVRRRGDIRLKSVPVGPRPRGRPGG